MTGWRSWEWSVFAGTDGVEAVDVPEVAGGGAGDCGVGFCAGWPSGAGEGAADEGVVAFLRLKGEAGAAVIPDKQMEDFRFCWISLRKR